MNEAEYFKNRLDPSINWFNKASIKAKRGYYLSNGVQIITASIIPGIVAVSDHILYAKALIALLSCIVAISSGIASLNQYHTQWTRYRNRCQLLENEKFLYWTHTSPYDGEARLQTLVERVESLLKNEVNEWYLKNRNSSEQNKCHHGT